MCERYTSKDKRYRQCMIYEARVYDKNIMIYIGNTIIVFTMFDSRDETFLYQTLDFNP